MCRYRAFGLALESSFALPGMTPLDEPLEAPLSLHLATAADVGDHWTGTGAAALWETVMDGEPVSVSRGGGGDHLIRFGDRASFWLSPGLDAILCAPGDSSRPAWQRFLLDTVLTCTSLLRGHEGLHASAVERGGGVVAFVTVSGGGKTSLAAELVARGAALVCDDILMLDRSGERLVAYPGPPVMNLPVRAGSTRVEALGEQLAVLGDEAWVAVRNAAREPHPPVAIVLLERAPGRQTQIVGLSPSPLPLLPHALGLGTTPERERQRFVTLSALAEQVSLYRLDADTSRSPQALADLVEAAVPTGSLPRPVPLNGHVDRKSEIAR
jgi:hypothetical protein